MNNLGQIEALGAAVAPWFRLEPGGTGKVFESDGDVMKGVIFCLISSVVLASVAGAKVDRRKAVPVPIPQLQGPDVVTYQDIQKVVPTDMEPTDRADQVAARIGDKAIQQVLNSPEMKNSSVVRAASKVENSMKAEVSVGSGEPDSIDHRFSFHFMALQSTGRLQYKGWLNAVMNVDTRRGETQVEVTERLFRNKDFYINHTASSVEDVSALGVRWNW